MHLLCRYLPLPPLPLAVAAAADAAAPDGRSSAFDVAGSL